jgi:hypothetical protein
MNKFIEEIISMRTDTDLSNLESYSESFKTADEFLVFKDEFIPIDLIESIKGGKRQLREIKELHGAPTVATTFDKPLSQFYKKYSLKRDINHIVDSIAYLSIKPIKSNLTKEKAVVSGDFLSSEILSKLSANQGKPYHADDDHLRKIGESINDFILRPTNEWVEKLNILDFETTPERYWQVAGAFKKRIWAKLSHPMHQDKKVFLCVGIDLENRNLFYGLECLRTGTSKLSTEQIYKFDHFTKKNTLIQTVKFDELNEYTWKRLIKQSDDFLSSLLPWYQHVINYIWMDMVDQKVIEKRLIPMSAKKPAPSDKVVDTNKKSTNLGIDLVVSYEKDLLKYKGKNDLAKAVAKIEPKKGSHDVHSFNIDGTDKLIKIISTKSASIQGASISQSCIESSIIHQEKSYLYILTNISTKRKAGLLHISKGRFDKILDLNAEQYSVNS